MGAVDFTEVSPVVSHSVANHWIRVGSGKILEAIGNGFTVASVFTGSFLLSRTPPCPSSLTLCAPSWIFILTVKMGPLNSYVSMDVTTKMPSSALVPLGQEWNCAGSFSLPFLIVHGGETSMAKCPLLLEKHRHAHALPCVDTVLLF